MRTVILCAIVLLVGCSGAPPSAGVVAGFMTIDGDEAGLTACGRTVDRSGAAIDDVTMLRLGSSLGDLTATWRGEADRWYPVIVGGELKIDGTVSQCDLTIDVGGGAWIVSGDCGGVAVSAEATGCE